MNWVDFAKFVFGRTSNRRDPALDPDVEETAILCTEALVQLCKRRGAPDDKLDKLREFLKPIAYGWVANFAEQFEEATKGKF